jgi:eukaryotic-like serine/threonine-protein kinase
VDLRNIFQGALVADRYRVTQFLGEGGFGAVFLAHHEVLGHHVRRVALKITKATGITAAQAGEVLGDAIMLARVIDEIEDGAAKRHLVRVYDMGVLKEHEHRGFIVMEYVSGSSLAEQMRLYQRLPEPTVVRYARQICTGLAAMHRLSPPVIHRDLKPDNVLLTHSDEVRIVDFGLAARIERACGYVEGAAGTDGYMAPETSILKVSNCASDVYSVGIMLYEMLTGVHPFAHLVPPPRLAEAQKREWICQQKQHNLPAPPSHRNNTIGPWLDRIVMRCLQYTEFQRYPSAAELLFDLARGSGGGDSTRERLCAEGRAAAEAQRWAEAETAFAKALALQPQRTDELMFRITYELALTLLELRKWAPAIERIRAAEDLDDLKHFLTSKRERAGFYAAIAEVCARQGNPLMAHKYHSRAQGERAV